MSELDYSFLDAIKSMAGESQVEDTSNDYSINYNINENSEDIEILDYIMVFICERVSSVQRAYKGGYVLMKMYPNTARYSHDIDFSISDKDQYELVKLVLDELGNDLINKGVISNYDIKDEIAPTKSGGIKLYRTDKMQLGIDIGLHDLSYGLSRWSFNGFSLSKFEIERMLSDKISAIFSKKRFRRAKDLYDFFIIYNSCNVDINKLAEFISIRGIDWNATPFREEVIREYSKAYDKLILKNIYGKEMVKPEFDECIKLLNKCIILIREVLFK